MVVLRSRRPVNSQIQATNAESTFLGYRLAIDVLGRLCILISVHQQVLYMGIKFDIYCDRRAVLRYCANVGIWTGVP